MPPTDTTLAPAYIDRPLNQSKWRSRNQESPVSASSATEISLIPSCISESRIRNQLSILLVNETGQPLPSYLVEPVLQIDPDAKIFTSWLSVMRVLVGESCSVPDLIILISTDCASAVQHLNDLWAIRLRNNYSVRPLYFGLSQRGQFASRRYEIERLGGHFLALSDVPCRFSQELEQVRLALGSLIRSLPTWLIAYEGNGETLRSHVFFLHRHTSSRVPGPDRQIAALTVLIKNNGIARSFAEWQKLLTDDPLFEPSGGSFQVPSINTLKQWLRRDFVIHLQNAFDQHCTGFNACAVIEHSNLGARNVKYRIRGQWSAVRK